MKKTRESFLTLIAELDLDASVLDELFQKNRLISEKILQGSPDQFDYAALGYTIHNIYNLMENYFQRIAGFFENNIGGDSWHRELIRRMTLEIPEVRPALLSRDMASEIGELRAFRHVFRNIYQSELDPVRVDTLNLKLPGIISKFKEAHLVYREKMQVLSRSV